MDYLLVGMRMDGRNMKQLTRMGKKMDYGLIGNTMEVKMKEIIKTVAGLGADEDGGVLDIYNKRENQVVSLQVNKNADGGIYLYDRYGEFGWGMSGKQ